MAVKGTDGFINEIVERSNGRKYKLGDFEIRNDFGVNAYYKGEGGDVVIPEELDGKATLWFGHAKNITSLCYPGSFKTVEHPNEFESKNTVQKLIFDEGVEEIRPNMGNTCFTGFKRLTDVVLPSTLKYLGKNAFKNSPWYEEHLETVDGCCYLGSFLVDSDKEIEKAAVREGTVMICNGAFKDREYLSELELPLSLEIIDNMAFNGCSSLTTVVIPESVKVIGYFAFTRCERLSEIEVPDDCSVSEVSFADKEKPVFPQKVHLPASVLTECDEPKLRDHYAVCYLTCRDRYSPEEKKQLDEEVKKRKSRILTSVIEHEHLAALEAASFAIDGKNIDGLIEKAQKCNAVNSTAFLLKLKEQMQTGDMGLRLTAKEKRPASKKTEDPYSVRNIKKNWSYETDNDGVILKKYKGTEKTVIIPERVGELKVHTLSMYLFEGVIYKDISKQKKAIAAIKSIEIPEGIRKIEWGCFFGCKALKTVTIPDSVIEMADSDGKVNTGLKDQGIFYNTPNVTIRCRAGSYAEEYAARQHIRVEIIE